MKGAVLPVVTVVLAIIGLWYLAAIPMNIKETLTEAERAGATITGGTAAERRDAGNVALTLRNLDLASGGWALERPRLPAPHQVAVELYDSTIDEELFSRRGILQSGEFSNRSLIYHGGVTLAATLLGFVIGTGLGILLAIGIVHNRTMDMSVMPWAIISQAIPIIAIAPMIIVVLYSVGLQGILPKAIISAYLSFFPVVVGMVKGLRTPEAIQLDLMRTYNASAWQVFSKLRWPASVPILFASMKVGIAISLIGAVVGELSNSAGGGLGVRLLTGSYNGQTIQIWAALFIAAALAAVLVILVGWGEKLANARMGVRA